MDSLVVAAARALAAGDAIGALKRVSLRDDPPALALRGIAMAQLGEHPRARELLRRASRGFGHHEEISRARCVVAEAEVALAMRDLGGSPRGLAAASATLEARADRANALHARLIAVRRLLLLGRLDEAASMLGALDLRGVPPSLTATAYQAAAEVALRRLRTAAARAALARAHDAAERAGVPALIAEVAEARAVLDRPAARRLHVDGSEQPLRLADVEALLGSGALVLDACRRGLGAGDTWLPLARRPVLFVLARALAEAWPGDVERNALIARAFRTRRPDETHRARLRVEMGRLRALAKPLARIEATARGYALVAADPSDDRTGAPNDRREVAVLVPPIDGEQASLLALLADGAAWSTSALALAVGASQRTVQRALVELEAGQRVRSVGRARAQRWLAPPLTGFTTILLLPAALPLT
ncbi:MAG TPA: helix-turn-helix domain-containing protein [Burkholderiaceae bacterium]|nr:helix-turn-helix domain-containing protein [Burkholderiaceae bacterium]